MLSRITPCAFLLLLPLLLIGCAGSPKPYISSIPCSPPADLMVPGDGPQPIPHRDLTPKEIVSLWGRDRADLQTETDRRKDLAGFVGEQCK